MSSYLDKTGLERVWSKATDKFATIATTDELKGSIETLTSTKADKTEVETAVANLIDSAPGTLNTLNELAAALGDDHNFATTVSTEIGKKVNVSDYNDTIAGINANIANITPENIGALPTTGGEVSGTVAFYNSAMSIRHAEIKDGTFRFRQTNPTDAWTPSLQLRKSDDSAVLGAYGFYKGNGDTLDYYYIGNTSVSPLFKMTPNGTISLAKALPVASGGTGATDAATARANLGAYSQKGGVLNGSLEFEPTTDSMKQIVFKRTTDDGTSHKGFLRMETGGVPSFFYRVNDETVNHLYLHSNKTELGQPLTIGSGGTGATDAATARTNLGITPANIGAAPTSHASTATTYGAASASNYGHAMASSTTPKANGTAAVGSETAKFARGDHVHPLQTSVSGSAGSVAWTGVSGKPSYYDAKAIKGITRSGTTFTYTCMDGTTGTFTQQDNNTTYSAGNGLSLSSTTFSVSYGTSASALGTSSAGSATTVSRSDHVHALPALTSCTGTLTVAKGGTGITSNPSMLVNLESTSAASVFAASPRPGITGTLPIGNGGTGATSKDGARTNLGITSGTSLPSSASAGDIFFLYS